MTTDILKAQHWLIILAYLFISFGCTEETENEVVSVTEYDQQWIKDLMGTPGIIGEINFSEISTSQYEEVNLLQIINHKEEQVVAQTTGTRLRDFANQRDYILTVAHLFDYEINDQPEHFILYVGKNGQFNGGDWFQISPMLYDIINPQEKDTFLIPVNYDPSAKAYNITTIFKTKVVDLPAHILIVSSLNLKNEKKRRKVKQAAKLIDKTRINNQTWKTDADLFLGTSGSPVFDETGRLIGLVSRISKAKHCEKYSSLICYNVIVPVEMNWVKQNLGFNSPKKMFRHVKN